METTKTLRKYVTPSIGVLDIRIERGFGGERDRDGFSVVPSRSGFIRRRIGGASAEENQSGRCEGKGIDYAVHKFDGFN